MWRSYEPPVEHEPEQPARWPVLPSSVPPQKQASPASYSSPNRGAPLVAIVGIMVTLAIGVGAMGSDGSSFEQSGWDACIESYADDEPGLITPADLCEIGHERPPGYTEYDDYDWDPNQDYDSWSDVEDDGNPPYDY